MPFLPLTNEQLLGVITAIAIPTAGWLVKHMSEEKKRRVVQRLLKDLDDIYARFKMNSRRCEAELYRLKDIAEEELTRGRISEASYKVLDAKINRYLSEIREQIEKESGQRA